MATKNGRTTASEEAKVNLTPMIDVTFQLIIFFMLVTELTNMALAQLVLPVANSAETPEKELGLDEVVVNIVREAQHGDDMAKTDGFIKIGMDEYRGQGQELTQRLRQRLKLEADVCGKWTDNPNRGPGGRNSELQVLVRCDRGVRAEYFLYVMWACNDVGIYRVNVAAKKELIQ